MTKLLLITHTHRGSKVTPPVWPVVVWNSPNPFIPGTTCKSKPLNGIAFPPTEVNFPLNCPLLSITFNDNGFAPITFPNTLSVTGRFVATTPAPLKLTHQLVFNCGPVV